MRALIIHKESGRERRRLKELVRYCLNPNPASKGKERVLGIIDGLDLGTADSPNPQRLFLPASVDLIAAQLCDDVPRGRRLYRNAVISLAAEVGEDLSLISIDKQVRVLEKLVRRYASIHAPGYRYMAIIHGDHHGEGVRGLHAHIIFKNSDAKGKALDWTRSDLSSQQSMNWATDLEVRPTRGTGAKRERGVRIPYPKSKNLDATKIGVLTHAELEQHIKSGRLTVGRRNKAGAITSVYFDGRRIRLSTARALVYRVGSLDISRSPRGAKTGPIARNGVVGQMAAEPSHAEPDIPTGRNHRGRSRRFGFGFGARPLEGPRRRKKGRRRSTVRGVGHGLKLILSTIEQVDKIGRVLR